jgi:parvulin-like peptidyl-prolyl isomerase
MLFSGFGWLPSRAVFSMGHRHRHLLVLPALVVAALTLAACGGDEERSAEDVPADAIALMGDTEVPRAEFDALMERAERSYKAQDRPFPKTGTPEYQDLKERAVAFLVQRYRFRAEAEELGVEVSDEDVTKELDEIKRENFAGDAKEFQAALKREGLTEEQARVEVRDRIIQERLYERVTEDVQVSDQDVRDHYDKNKEQFSQPASRTIRHILVKRKARADQLYRQLQDGADFAALARRFSTDRTSAKDGGRIPITKGSTVPEFDKVAFELDTGEISRPVKTQFGWHVITAETDVKEAKPTPFARVEKSIRQQLLSERKNEALQEWLKSLEEKYQGETVFAAGFEPPRTDTGTTGAGTTSETTEE